MKGVTRTNLLLMCAAFVKLSVSARSQNTFKLSICMIYRTRSLIAALMESQMA